MEIEAKHPRDGPDLETYVETRFNLLSVQINKLEESIRERITAVLDTSTARFEQIQVQFKHQSEVTDLIHTTTDAAHAATKATQDAHNLASNEWRRTFQDFKDATTPRPEFNRLAADFSAYKLEIAQTVAAKQISDAGVKQGSNETRASAGMVIGMAVGAATLVGLVVNYLRPAPQVAISPISSEKRVDDVIERLNSLSARINALQQPPTAK